MKIVCNMMNVFINLFPKEENMSTKTQGKTQKKSITDLEAALSSLDNAPATEGERVEKVKNEKKMTVKVDGKVSKSVEKKEKKEKIQRPKYFHAEEIKKAGGKKIFDQTKVNYKFASQAIRDMLEKNGLKDSFKVEVTRPKKEIKNPEFDKVKGEAKDNPKTVKADIFRIELKDKDGNVVEKVQFSTEEVLGRSIMNIIYKVGNKIHSGEMKS